MKALVTIAGTALPEPSSYSGTTSTLVDSARNVKGYVVGSVVRSDVAKVELTWRYLTAEQWATVLSLFKKNFYNEVEFYDQTVAGWVTRKMYVSDRTAGMFRRNPENGNVMGYTDCALSLVEV
jgi:hypothetical protein